MTRRRRESRTFAFLTTSIRRKLRFAPRVCLRFLPTGWRSEDSGPPRVSVLAHLTKTLIAVLTVLCCWGGQGDFQFTKVDLKLLGDAIESDRQIEKKSLLYDVP